MNNEDILKSDLLDLIFDKRNKNYGAYELRKHYKRRLIKALVVAFVFAGGIAALTSFIKEDKVLVSVFEIPDTDPALPPVNNEKKPEQPKQPEKPKLPAASKPVAAQQHVANIDIVKDPLQASKINTLDENKAIAGQNSDGENKGQVIVPPPTIIDAGGNDVDITPKVDIHTARPTADIMPAYPGGMKELKKFLEKNLKSFDDIEEGKVISVRITFVVGYDGKLKGFQVMEDGGDMYNKEVIRVLKKMPDWIPGKANGENVSVYYTIPVKFTSAE